MKLSQEIVLHQDHYDRSKCCTWTDKQDHLVCVRPVSSSLQAAGHWQSPRVLSSSEYQTARWADRDVQG